MLLIEATRFKNHIVVLRYWVEINLLYCYCGGKNFPFSKLFFRLFLVQVNVLMSTDLQIIAVINLDISDHTVTLNKYP